MMRSSIEFYQDTNYSTKYNRDTRPRIGDVVCTSKEHDLTLESRDSFMRGIVQESYNLFGVLSRILVVRYHGGVAVINEDWVDILERADYAAKYRISHGPFLMLISTTYGDIKPTFWWSAIADYFV